MQFNNETHNEIVAKLKKLREERSTEMESVAAEYIAQAQKIQDKKLELDVLFQLCVYQNHVQSDYLQSIESAKQCLTLAQQIKDYTYTADALRMLGVNYNYTGDLTQAREAYETGIKVLKNQEKLTNDDKVILAGLYFNTVTLYKEFELDTVRLQYIDKAFELFTETKNIQGIARCYISYANNYPGIKDTPKALEYFTKAAELFKSIGDRRGEGNCLINVGYQYSLQGKFEEGERLIKEGTEYLEEASSNVFIANGYFLLGIAYRLQGKWAEAIQQFKRVEDLTLTSKTGFSRATLYEEWAIALEQGGKTTDALSMYKQYYKSMVEMYQFDKSSAVSDARVTFELEERKREAEVLKRKNAEIEEYTHRLEISNAELKQFAHIASHDLKEPLRMVTLYMQLLEKHSAQRLTEDGLQYLYYAKEGASRMYNLIESILQLSKINPDIKSEVVDLNKILREVQEFLLPEMQEKNFRVLTGVLPKVKANRHQMEQLFQNLVSNAIKFSKNENPLLDISFTEQDGFYCIDFNDNGIGIPPSYRLKVFEIFQRLHSRERYAGTGIGLTICKKIIEHHNGKIWIDDGTDGGCSFKFSLPV